MRPDRLDICPVRHTRNLTPDRSDNRTLQVALHFSGNRANQELTIKSRASAIRLSAVDASGFVDLSRGINVRFTSVDRRVRPLSPILGFGRRLQ